jgi:dolichol-phosphate mannosyltransferase
MTQFDHGRSVEAAATRATPRDAPLLSVVTPALNEAANVAAFHERLSHAVADLDRTAEGWEWILVDDGSQDGTADAVAAIGALDRRVRSIALGAHRGAHPAILRGLAESRGAAVFVLAVDLQDPPELALDLLAHWRGGAQIVWAVRRNRDGEARAAVALSELYHALAKRMGGSRGLPPGGAGCVLVDRAVADLLHRTTPPPVDVFAAAGTFGVPSATVDYERSPRRHGRSRWTTGMKVRFALRSLLTGRNGRQIRLP